MHQKQNVGYKKRKTLKAGHSIRTALSNDVIQAEVYQYPLGHVLAVKNESRNSHKISIIDWDPQLKA